MRGAGGGKERGRGGLWEKWVYTEGRGIKLGGRGICWLVA